MENISCGGGWHEPAKHDAIACDEIRESDIAGNAMQDTKQIHGQAAPVILWKESKETNSAILDGEIRQTTEKLAETPMPAYAMKLSQAEEDGEITEDRQLQYPSAGGTEPGISPICTLRDSNTLPEAPETAEGGTETAGSNGGSRRPAHRDRATSRGITGTAHRRSGGKMAADPGESLRRWRKTRERRQKPGGNPIPEDPEGGKIILHPKGRKGTVENHPNIYGKICLRVSRNFSFKKLMSVLWEG